MAERLHLHFLLLGTEFREWTGGASEVQRGAPPHEGPFFLHRGIAEAWEAFTKPADCASPVVMLARGMWPASHLLGGLGDALQNSLEMPAF